VITALANAFKVEELRKKILFTLGMIAVYRVGAHIPVPGITAGDLAAIAQSTQSGILGLLNLFSGGALQQFAVFSLGIMPYITATIIMQLLTAVIPTVERWSKEGETGQRKITQVSRYLTLAIGFVESIGYIALFQTTLLNAHAITVPFTWLTRIVMLITLLAGTAFIMWMGELITQRGIGNGMSLLIFANIIARFPQAIFNSFVYSNILIIIAVVVTFLVVIAAIVTMEKSQRRIPVQYAKRIVGRKVYGGAGTYIPLKINGANVVPIIFAIAILQFPAVIARFIPATAPYANYLSTGSVLYLILLAALIVFFTYFYTALIFNPIDLADNLRKQGGFIPGVRPGKNTVTYIENVLLRINLPGALFLAAVAVLPTILFNLTKVPSLQSFGGTSILIMVGVSLETMNQLESQLKMRHYEGFFR
jgi:preprotein translocase subunit SecY